MEEGTSNIGNSGSGSTREARSHLREIIELCLAKARDGDFSDDQQTESLEKATALQVKLDGLVDEAFTSRTADLAQLTEELRQLNEDITKKSSEISAKDEKFQGAADFLALVDKALGVLKKFI